MPHGTAVLSGACRTAAGVIAGAILLQALAPVAGYSVQFRLYLHMDAMLLQLGAVIGAVVWGGRVRPLPAALLGFLAEFLPLAYSVAWKATSELAPSGLPLYALAVILDSTGAALAGYVLALSVRWWPAPAGTAAARSPGPASARRQLTRRSRR